MCILMDMGKSGVGEGRWGISPQVMSLISQALQSHLYLPIEARGYCLPPQAFCQVCAFPHACMLRALTHCKIIPLYTCYYSFRGVEDNSREEITG